MAHRKILKKEKMMFVYKLARLLPFHMILVISLFGFTRTSYTQTNDDCLMCHSDNTLTMEKNGKEVSIYVDANILKNSAHGKLNCISCHVGFNPDEVPHKENIKPINCLKCHSSAPAKHPFHSQILKSNGMGGSPDQSCKNCHGTHGVIPPSSPKSPWNSKNLVNSCGNCHSDKKEEYVKSIHYQGFKAELKVRQIVLLVIKLK